MPQISLFIDAAPSPSGKGLKRGNLPHDRHVCCDATPSPSRRGGGGFVGCLLAGGRRIQPRSAGSYERRRAKLGGCRLSESLRRGRCALGEDRAQDLTPVAGKSRTSTPPIARRDATPSATSSPTVGRQMGDGIHQSDACRSPPSARPSQQSAHFFLNINDDLGFTQLLGQALVVLAELLVVFFLRVAFGLGAALVRGQALEDAGLPLATPCDQVRGVKIFTAQ